MLILCCIACDSTIDTGGGAVSATLQACTIQASAYIDNDAQVSTVLSKQPLPMYVHFRAGIDPLMTAWDFCILHGNPYMTHGTCVEDIMVRGCHFSLYHACA
jgi:hypothetical protein